MHTTAMQLRWTKYGWSISNVLTV